ncbi:unnamed protein product, partial [Rhizoctonia solani]
GKLRLVPPSNCHHHGILLPPPSVSIICYGMPPGPPNIGDVGASSFRNSMRRGFQKAMDAITGHGKSPSSLQSSPAHLQTASTLSLQPTVESKVGPYLPMNASQQDLIPILQISEEQPSKAIPTPSVSSPDYPSVTIALPNITFQNPTPENISTIVNPDSRCSSWPRLRKSLHALHNTVEAFPPFYSVIGTLISCLDFVQVSRITLAEHRQEYSLLISDIADHVTTLDKFIRESKSATISDCVANTVISLTEEANFIRKRKEQGVISMALDANEASDAIARCYRRIDTILRQLQIDADLSTWSVANEILANKRLDGLSLVKLASYDSALPANIVRQKCTDNTRTEILTGTNIWLNEPKTAKIYWMSGMAGTGKTTIAYSLASAFAHRKQLGASYFCSRVLSDCRDVRRIIPTIAYQLARYSRPFQAEVCKALESDPDLGTKEMALQFERLLKAPLRVVRGALPNNVVVVVDALDECDDGEGVKNLIRKLFELAKETPIKVFISSRPEREIREEILSHEDSTRSILHLHTIDQAQVKEDIALYLRAELSFMSPSEQDIERLAELSGCLFIYAATAVRYIRSRSTNPQQRLQAVLSVTVQSNKKYAEIDSLYSRVLDVVFHDELEDYEIKTMQDILWTAVCIREPANVSTVAALSGIDDGDALGVLESLRSVLFISENNHLVSPLHASFTDYIFSPKRCGKYYCNETRHSYEIAHRCFGIMQAQLRFNICNLESSFHLDQCVANLSGRVQTFISQPLSYACRNWGNHLSSSISPTELREMLQDFLSNRLLFWMEVLNLTKSITSGVVLLQRARIWLQEQNADAAATTTILKMISDSINFVIAFSANPISDSTPHIYISALSFCSKSSLVSARYSARAPGLLSPHGDAMEKRGMGALATWRVGPRIRSLALSSDGDSLVFGGGNGTIGIINPYTGNTTVGPVNALVYGITKVALSPNGSRILFSGEDGTICTWDAGGEALLKGKRQTYEQILQSPPSGQPHPGDDSPISPIRAQPIRKTDVIRSVTFSPDGTLIASTSLFDNGITIWTLKDNSVTPSNHFLGHSQPVQSVAFSTNGRRVVSGSEDKTLRVWGVQKGDSIDEPFKGHEGAVLSVVVSHDGKRAASGSADSTIRIWTIDKLTKDLLLPSSAPFKGHHGEIHTVTFSPDSSLVASGSSDATVRVWNTQNATLIAGPFVGHSGPVLSVLFSSDADRIFSVSEDETIRLWSIGHTPLVSDSSKGATGRVRSIGVSPDGTCVVSGSDDGTLSVRSIQDGQLIGGLLLGHTGPVNSVAFSPDGQVIASGSDDGTVRVWSSESHIQLISSGGRYKAGVRSVSFSPDGKCIASGSLSNKGVHLWDAQNGTPFADPFQGHHNGIMSVAFSPDGGRVVSGSPDMTIRIWDAQDGSPIDSPFTSQTRWVCSVAFSPDGTKVAFTDDELIRIWTSHGGMEAAPPLVGHTGRVNSVAFSPDGMYIASGSSDKTVRLWDVQTGKPIGIPFGGHTDKVESVAFSPDGSIIASGSHDRTIRITDTDFIRGNLGDTPIGSWSISEEGWAINKDGHHLFWVPHDLRDILPRAEQRLVIGPQGAIRINYVDPRIKLGPQWPECFTNCTLL